MNPNGRLPNAVIAGTNKAGTTSLFRYLADHPAVCVSSVKETAFFRKVSAPISEASLAEYRSLFAHCSPDSPILLEATPAYLAGGRRTAAAMREVIPDVRLIFVLREPAGRLLSDWKRRGERLQPELRDLDGESFVNKLAASENSTEADDPFAAMRRSVCYADRLREYLEFFPAEQMAIRFFDDLKADARSFMNSICGFLDIEGEFYDAYSFQVENRTRSYRSRWLHRLAFQMNMMLEHRLNRSPRLRNGLRRAYNQLNARSGESGRPEAEEPEYVRRLQELFASENIRLGALLDEYFPDISPPAWIPFPDAQVRDPADGEFLSGASISHPPAN